MKWDSYRVTKYDPSFRDENGWFTLKEEWTSISDVGNFYNGIEFTMDEYVRTEEAYLSSVRLFMKQNNVTHFNVKGLEIQYRDKDFLFGELGVDLFEKMVVDQTLSLKIIKLMLREELWCKLTCSRMEIHKGYDYYMYMLTKSPVDPLTMKEVEKLGMFVEEFESPYS